MTKRWLDLSEAEIAEKSAANRKARYNRIYRTADLGTKDHTAICESTIENGTVKIVKVRIKKPAKTRQKPPTEHAEQCKVIQWWDAFAPSYGLDKRILFAVPNGSHKSMHQAAKFKAEGLRPGVPDLFLAKGNGYYFGMFIELKRTKGSVISDEQKSMITLLIGRGYKVALCKGHNEAINAIKDYLG